MATPTRIALAAMPGLSVVICTHNRARLLQRALDSLNEAARPSHWHIEILVIANACNDGTIDLLRQYQWLAASRDALPLRFADEPRPGKARALNLAAQLIRTAAVACIDDDHRVHENFLGAACSAFDEHPEASLFCGRILPDWDGTEPAWVHDTGPHRIYPPPVPRFDLGDRPMTLAPGGAVPGGGNLCLRSGLLAAVGGFAEALGPVGHDLGGGEDTDWVLRALDRGAVLRYVPGIVQYHHVDRARLTLRYTMRKAFRRAAAVSGLERNRPASGRPPRYLYRKAAGYLGMALLTTDTARRRFCLVRLASVLGDIFGLRTSRPLPGASPAPTRTRDGGRPVRSTSSA